MDVEVAKIAAEQFKDKDYGCGTANLETPSLKIKCVVSKKVKWDEGELRKIAEQIRASGNNPENFIKYKLSVSEAAFKGFSPEIQEAFVPARSVEPSAPKITIERK